LAGDGGGDPGGTGSPLNTRDWDAGLVFVTKFGRPWATSDHASNAVTLQFGKLLRKVKLNGRGLSFYRLRHTFRTVADPALDQHAIDSVMGHANQSMAANFTHGTADDRLKAVAEHVRQWLFPSPSPEQSREADKMGRKSYKEFAAEGEK
jgi:integrase